MEWRSAQNRSPAPGRGSAAPGWVALGWVVLIGLGSCSVEKHYKILSFWFDGVPDPKAKARAGASGLGSEPDARSSPTYSAHRPFVQDECRECHSSRFRLGSGDSQVCLKCHQDRTTEYPRMHGPVSAVACLWCHSPHDSAYAWLLKSDGRALCMQCHEQGLLRTEGVAAHGDELRKCLECHRGHGGESAGFLRPGIAADSSVRPTP